MENFSHLLENYLKTAPIFAYPIVFLAGLLTSFTPCVYPMIPITIGYIGGRATKSKLHNFFLAFSYVLGIAITYSILGALAAITGTVFGKFAGHPLTYFVIGNLCLILSLSMLDVFLLPIPSFLTNIRTPQKASKFLGPLFIGLISGFIAAPCTTPVLASILVFVASKQNILFGVSLLFTFAIGLGFLLLLVGTFAGMLTVLPKSGAWMEKIKKIFGWIMLGTAEYFFIQMGKLMI